MSPMYQVDPILTPVSPLVMYSPLPYGGLDPWFFMFDSAEASRPLYQTVPVRQWPQELLSFL